MAAANRPALARDTPGGMILRQTSPRPTVRERRTQGRLMEQTMILSNVIGAAIASWKRWQSYVETVRQLEALDDRELDDLGISRCEIESVARSAAAH